MNQGQYRNRVSFGKRQEFIAIAELLRRGFDVYLPLVDDQQIDCVIRLGDHDYVDVQIKSRSKEIADKNAGLFSAMQIPNPRENYFFLFYVEHPDVDAYWIFPSLELVEKASRNKKGKNKGKYSINLTGCRGGQVYALDKFSRYKNNFDLLQI